MPETCRTCKAPIRWAVTAAGHLMPLDVEPVADGNLRLDRDIDGETPRVLAVPKRYRTADEPLYVAHFRTCPYADHHRRIR
jgi:hypothetical protein